MAKFAILDKFYTSDTWRKFRLNLINERGNKCEKCGKVIAKAGEIIGHHRKELTPENVNDYSISLNPELVELICFDCHNEEHGRFGHKSKREIYLVYGPPLAGKKDYVKRHMHRGDIVIDMDRLYEAVSMLPQYDKPDNLFINVIGIHNIMIDNVMTRYGKFKNAWIIGGYADRYKRETIANKTGAELIFCDVSKEECLARLETEENLKYRKAEWKKYIERWFESYTE